MKISQVIELLESEMKESEDVELLIYDSNGDRIEPKSLSYGAMSTSKGFLNTVSFSDVE